jgi:hypothetical protein
MCTVPAVMCVTISVQQPPTSPVPIATPTCVYRVRVLDEAPVCHCRKPLQLGVNATNPAYTLGAVCDVCRLRAKSAASFWSCVSCQSDLCVGCAHADLYSTWSWLLPRFNLPQSSGPPNLHQSSGPSRSPSPGPSCGGYGPVHCSGHDAPEATGQSISDLAVQLAPFLSLAVGSRVLRPAERVLVSNGRSPPRSRDYTYILHPPIPGRPFAVGQANLCAPLTAHSVADWTSLATPPEREISALPRNGADTSPSSSNSFVSDRHVPINASVAVAQAAGARATLELCHTLSPEDCTLLAEAWAQDALGEHASVASFARHTLSLLAVCAPPNLLMATQISAIQEVQHAVLCFSVAQAYSNAAQFLETNRFVSSLGLPSPTRAPLLGPGAFPLPLNDCSTAATRAALAAETAQAGCVNELASCLLAALSLSRVSAYTTIALEDSTVPSSAMLARTLGRLCADEVTHCGLAWRTLQWLLSSGDLSVSSSAREALATVLDAREEAHGLDRSNDGEEAMDRLLRMRPDLGRLSRIEQHDVQAAVHARLTRVWAHAVLSSVQPSPPAANLFADLDPMGGVDQAAMAVYRNAFTLH